MFFFASVSSEFHCKPESQQQVVLLTPAAHSHHSSVSLRFSSIFTVHGGLDLTDFYRDWRSRNKSDSKAKVLRSVPLFAPVSALPWSVQRFYTKEEMLTKGKEAEDDGVGDQVDRVAGAREVELATADALVHRPHLLSGLRGKVNWVLKCRQFLTDQRTIYSISADQNYKLTRFEEHFFVIVSPHAWCRLLGLINHPINWVIAHFSQLTPITVSRSRGKLIEQEILLPDMPFTAS